VSGIDLVADTNFLIAVHEGDERVVEFLDYTMAVSIISEIELLGFVAISENEKRKLRQLIRSCEVITLSEEIKELAITIRQKQRVKIPDAIIAATSIFLKVPLVTFDHEFAKIPNLDLLLLSR
jgi:predicted nucleic acid-binding protein